MVSENYLFPAHLCIGKRIEKFKKNSTNSQVWSQCFMYVTYLQYCIYLMVTHTFVCMCVHIFTAKLKSSLYIHKIVMFMFHLTNRYFLLFTCKYVTKHTSMYIIFFYFFYVHNMYFRVHNMFTFCTQHIYCYVYVYIHTYTYIYMYIYTYISMYITCRLPDPINHVCSLTGK